MESHRRSHPLFRPWRQTCYVKNDRWLRAIVVAHNHPSGSLEPSNEDHEVTRRLAEAGQLLGFRSWTV
ncbi:MAG: JAB domain-containing protein [Spirochaetota bacterium]